jgi:hypothetical protein
MRTEAQTLLGRVKLHKGATRTGEEIAGSDRPRTPLAPGTYPEPELRASHIGWHGKVDLLTLSGDGCEIVDFKTGARDDAHRFQLRVYALLWSRDIELNPTAREADKFTLLYRDGEVVVEPPTAAELDALERELIERRQAAAKALSANPPQARPSIDNCQYCSVRHLCEEYWQPATARALAPATLGTSAFTDLQMSIVGRHGPSSWDGVVEQSRGVSSGRSVLLRTPIASKLDFATGARIRVLDAHITSVADNGDQPVVATSTMMTEMFLV